MNIYVGNLSYNAEEKDLLEIFGKFGEVSSVKIISDRATGKPRGFGFVEMEDTREAQNAINNLNKTELLGRALIVNAAREKEKKTRDSYDNRY
jgi:RNA recognition motif-containing protein